MRVGAEAAISLEQDAGPISYAWNWGDGAQSSGGPTASHTYGSSGSFTVTLTVTDQVGQTGTASQSVVPHTAPTTPSSFTATASTTTSVSLAWNASTSSSGIAYYVIQRRSSQSGAWGPERTTTATTFTDTGLNAATLYQYRVEAVDNAGGSSAFAQDYATTVLFGADLQRSSSIITAAHIRDLRDAVDAWRLFAGLSDVYPANPLPAGVIKAANFITNTASDPLPGVVDALNAARGAMSLPAFSYSVPAPAVGGVAALEHVQQLREAMR